MSGPAATGSDSAEPAAKDGSISPFVVGLIAFVTLVDLFAAQAVLPLLTERYSVTPARMSLALNASTIGMAVASLGVAVLDRHLDRKAVVLGSLVMLAVPTALLAVAPNLAVFTFLRVAQGLCMATAFSLTLAYLSEHAEGARLSAAVAAYIGGNVSSNLFGRLLAAAVAEAYGVERSFQVFAGVNLLGALLVFAAFKRSSAMMAGGHQTEGVRALARHLRNPPLLAAFGLGFCILFAFLGVFTYVNFVLVRPPLSLAMMSVGLAYFVFAPAIVLTPAAGRAARAFGERRAIWAALAVAAAGLPLLLLPSIVGVLAGMVLTATGLFFAQAVGTGFIPKVAGAAGGSASGLYLAAYFCGGLAASALLGPVFDRFGWAACVAGVAAALAAAAVLTAGMVQGRARPERMRPTGEGTA